MMIEVYPFSTLSMFEKIMPQRGRPAKVLSSADLDELCLFLQNLPFRKKNQIRALDLLERVEQDFDEAEMKVLKLADREKNLHQQRLVLLYEIQIKAKNTQKLDTNEAEIFDLSAQYQDQDVYFRLHRALESYQKLHQALLNDRIRLQNERIRDILAKTSKSPTEAQKRRNEENRRKYEVGGAVLALFKELNVDIESKSAETLKGMLKHELLFTRLIQKTEIYKQSFELTKNTQQARVLFLQALNDLPSYTLSDEKIHLVLLKKNYQLLLQKVAK
ncbi:hypothetical protein I2F27_11715 [Acinetobacter sp. B5B]|uniref:hypothetical protein n=1 Tax=Acinetobacter baretiae TaxID=2605383 RepID=UPI0018C1E14A|nr:hypothetical protein [Acinetobacter baretiae]MBF7683980.1 hypothetical protein [Acinetobacter baretiae]